MQRINRKIFVAFLIFSFAVSPLSFTNITTLLRVDASQKITGYQEWNQSLIIDSNVTVSAGATLVINKGVNVSFTQKWLNLYVYGTLIVKGTGSAPVTFSGADKDNFSIVAKSDSTILINGANMVNGGYSAMLMKSVSNTALASGYKGALQIDGGNVKVRNTTFKNSSNAVIVSTPDAIVQVNYSKFIDNGFDVESSSNSDFRYNWWGLADGPQQTCYNPGMGQICYYEKIDDSIDFSNWLPEKDFHDPVIIIPGILGAAEKEGKMQIDPIFHTYDNLYAEFANNGYVPEKDLFVFPYEWRDSNVENAKLLKDEIAEIKSITKWPKIDVVAHSMGGLLAREYIESDYYGDDVDQLITLATPNLGAPESYMKWDGDGWFLGLADIFMKHIVTQEAEEGGFADRFDYIHNRPITSLQELLPVYDYLYEADNEYDLKTYPIGYPRNEFLEKLNDNAFKLTSAVEYDKIIGNTNGNDTISGINIVNTDMGKYWIDGYPLGFEIPIGDRGIRYNIGDVTVPLISSKSENISSDNLIELPSDHRSIVTDAQKDVLELLTTDRPDTKVESSLIKNIFITQVFSPIDIQVIAPDGKRVGKDFATGEIFDEIEGAYYSGYETENEFLTIPNPLSGQYQILTQGTGEGGFKIETTVIAEQSDGSAQESMVTLIGTATPDAENAFTVKVADETVIDPNAQDKVDEDQNDDSQDVQAEQEPVIEETQEVVAESSHEKKTEKHQQESSKEDDNQLAVVENSELQASTISDSRDENSIVANLKNGFDKLSQDIELAKTAQAEEVIKKNSETGNSSGKIVFEIFASLAVVFVARKGLLFFLTKI